MHKYREGKVKSTLERELKDLKLLGRKLCVYEKSEQSFEKKYCEDLVDGPSRLETRTKESSYVASLYMEMCRRNESDLYHQ